MSFDRLLEQIIRETTRIMEAERTPLYCILLTGRRERSGPKFPKRSFDRNDEIILEAIASQVAITIENHFLIDALKTSFESSIRTLSATVDARHPLTARHSQRVTDYSLTIAGGKWVLAKRSLRSSSTWHCFMT